MKHGIFLMASMALSLFAQSQLNAGLVITSVASLSSQTDTTATMLVSVYGERSGAITPELVSSFGLKLTINGVTPTISSPTFAPASSEWFAFNNKPAPTTTANSVTFQSFIIPVSNNVPIASVGKIAATLIGTFSFTVNKTVSSQAFDIMPTADTAPGTGADGFLRDTTNFFSPVATVYTPPTNSTNGAGTITAVPEPSSFALLGLVSCAYMHRRRRALKAG